MQRALTMLRARLLPCITLLGVASIFSGTLAAADTPLATNQLTSLSLEQLMSIEVTSVSKHAEPVAKAPAAIHVLTGDDIRRSGATSIPEALRMVPGINVSQINPGNWAISSRGFNGRFASKLLVMIDGRSVYTPLFSGVYWDVQDTLLEDIERIEVIRGPGASLWGANAVNGVINIITKDAFDTQGGMLSGGGGWEETAFGAVRYGGKLNEHTAYRAFVKYNQRDDTQFAMDGTDIWRGGYRVDWRPQPGSSGMLQSELYAGDTASGTGVGMSTVAGGHALARWDRELGADSTLRLQTWFDRTERVFDIVTEYRNTFDLEAQHQFLLGEKNRLAWGAGYRFTSDQTFGSPQLTFAPAEVDDHLASFFVQDEVTLLPDKLSLTFGSKLEHNQYTGLEVQPSARLSWQPYTHHSLWASVSRAVRSPSRAETDVTAVSGGPPGLTTVVRGAPMQSEELLAFELGWRAQLHRTFSTDLALFYNDYDRLRAFDFTFTPVPPTATFSVNNAMDGHTYGGELSLNWQPVSWWRWQASYTLLQMHLRNGLVLPDATFYYRAEDNPQQQIHLRSSLDLPHGFEFDTQLYYQDSLPGLGVPAYARLDFRLGWKHRDRFEASIVLQNALDPQHREYGNASMVVSSEIQRTLYGKLTWRF
ncbi:MAG TPA: TonB-dependent receptor [Verrucomicrobiae bacterium]